MARPWRDVIAAEEFGDLIKSKLKTEEGTVAVHDKKRVKTKPKEALKDIHNELKKYHLLAKPNRVALPDRMQQLDVLTARVGSYMRAFQIDESNVPRPKGQTSKKDPTKWTIDRILLSIAHRAQRKKNYIGRLIAFLTSPNYRGAAELLEYVRSPQEKQNGLIGLAPHVRMEAIDFEHRDGYEDANMGQIFEEWATSDRNDTPFFLWLEDHPICTSSNVATAISVSKTIGYVDHVNRTAPSTSKFKIVAVGPPLMMYDFSNQPAVLASTQGYYAGSQKAISPSNNMGDNLAAFVWGANRELYIGEHYASKFHHSSLLAGQAVGCAGMIRIENGLIREVSNNSGHYKPTAVEMANFMTFMRDCNCIHRGCHIKISMANNRGWSGTEVFYLRHAYQIANYAT